MLLLPLSLGDEFGQRHSQCHGDSFGDVEARSSLAPLQWTKVGVMDARFLGPGVVWAHTAATDTQGQFAALYLHTKRVIRNGPYSLRRPEKNPIGVKAWALFALQWEK